MKRAIYPGTFDPVTNGHLDLIRRSLTLCDELIIAVASNEKKGPLFSSGERRKLMLQTLEESGLKARVETFGELLVDFVKKQDARMVIRGVRAFSDFEYEFQMALMNRRLSSEFETVFLMPHETYSYVSSRMIKEVFRLGGSVEGLVPKCVEKALAERFGRAPLQA